MPATDASRELCPLFECGRGHLQASRHQDELRRIVEFIQLGGFAKARANEIAELERQRRELEAARTTAARERRSDYELSAYTPRENALSLAAAAIVSSFFD